MSVKIFLIQEDLTEWKNSNHPFHIMINLHKITDKEYSDIFIIQGRPQA